MFWWLAVLFTSSMSFLTPLSTCFLISEREVLKSPDTIVELSFSPFNSVDFALCVWRFYNESWWYRRIGIFGLYLWFLAQNSWNLWNLPSFVYLWDDLWEGPRYLQTWGWPPEKPTKWLDGERSWRLDQSPMANDLINRAYIIKFSIKKL